VHAGLLPVRRRPAALRNLSDLRGLNGHVQECAFFIPKDRERDDVERSTGSRASKAWSSPNEAPPRRAHRLSGLAPRPTAPVCITSDRGQLRC
jgi:hypothetical protein